MTMMIQYNSYLLIYVSMKIEQKSWDQTNGWLTVKSTLGTEIPQLVLVFGGRDEVSNPDNYAILKQWYPQSNIVMCSTAGEIIDTKVHDHSLAVTAIYFEKTTLTFTHGTLAEGDSGEVIGGSLAESIPKVGLKHVMVFSDGLQVNGTSLVKGILKHLPNDISVTGGLVGDGTDFKVTVVGLNQVPEPKQVVMIGFYGEDIKIGYGSLGGWDSFGPVRLVTKSEKNVLYELDGKPALQLYKQYLGEQATDLPSSGLLFPLNLHLNDGETSVEVVRTLLAVNEDDQSMTFAGDLPTGSSVNLMKANFERLIDGATGAASMSQDSLRDSIPNLAILISCIGRKLVLKDRIEEETEAVKQELGGNENTFMTGFYSYGEISPVAATEKQCRLHNQTMTITTFKE